jgi:hypothetical protein
MKSYLRRAFLSQVQFIQVTKADGHPAHAKCPACAPRLKLKSGGLAARIHMARPWLLIASEMRGSDARVGVVELWFELRRGLYPGQGSPDKVLIDYTPRRT